MIETPHKRVGPECLSSVTALFSTATFLLYCEVLQQQYSLDLIAEQLIAERRMCGETATH